VEIDIRVEVLGAEGIDLARESLRDVGIAQMLPDDGAVIRFRQAVVAGAARARLGEFHPQLGHGVIDVLRAVVGMEAHHAEGKPCQHGLDHRQEVGLADLLAGGHQFPLCHAVYGISVIDALHATLIAPMHAVEVDEAGASFGDRRVALANGYSGRLRLGPVPSALGVAGALPQVVQVCCRDRRQPLVADVAVGRKRPQHQMPRGRPRQRSMQAVSGA